MDKKKEPLLMPYVVRLEPGEGEPTHIGFKDLDTGEKVEGTLRPLTVNERAAWVAAIQLPSKEQD
jgi:hypothetical protein